MHASSNALVLVYCADGTIEPCDGEMRTCTQVQVATQCDLTAIQQSCGITYGSSARAFRIGIVESAKTYLSLGSNVGDRHANLREAIAALERIGVRVLRVSSIYETEPVDYLHQGWFLNCVVEAETALEPLALLCALRGIEVAMGSTKPVPKGPRLIDMDVLLYGNETVDTAELQVPHPRMRSRRFVLVPLAEIAPELRHPSWNETVQELLAGTPDRSAVRLVDDVEPVDDHRDLDEGRKTRRVPTS